MAGYPVNGSEIIKMIFKALVQHGRMTARQIANEILEDEEDVSRALIDYDGECVRSLLTDQERWEAIPGENDEDYF
jgi:hypothetical protein